jgi:hypothetical protein
MSNYNFNVISATINTTYYTLYWIKPQSLPHTSHATTFCAKKPHNKTIVPNIHQFKTYDEKTPFLPLMSFIFLLEGNFKRTNKQM